jgi:hypothetical protein
MPCWSWHLRRQHGSLYAHKADLSAVPLAVPLRMDHLVRSSPLETMPFAMMDSTEPQHVERLRVVRVMGLCGGAALLAGLSFQVASGQRLVQVVSRPHGSTDADWTMTAALRPLNSRIRLHSLANGLLCVVALAHVRIATGPTPVVQPQLLGIPGEGRRRLLNAAPSAHHDSDGTG